MTARILDLHLFFHFLFNGTSEVLRKVMLAGKRIWPTVILLDRGVAKDYKQAATLFEKAAMQGDPSAQYNLGTLYENSRDVPKNVVHAYAWLLVAASHKHAKAIEASIDWEGRLNKDEIEAGHSLAADYEKLIGSRPNDESKNRLNPQ